MSGTGRLVLKFKEGESFFVGDQKYTVTKIVHPMKFKVEKDGSMPVVMTIDASHREELEPNVFLSAGPKRDNDAVSAVFEAPKSVRLDRESVYYDRNPDKAVSI